MQKCAPLNYHHHLLQNRELLGRFSFSVWLWHPLLSLRELTEWVQSSMWQWATKSNAFPNNYSTFLLVLGDTRLQSKCLATWELQLHTGNALPGTVPLTKWKLPTKMGNWKKRVSFCLMLFIGTSLSTLLLLSFLPKVYSNQGNKSLFLYYPFINTFKMLKISLLPLCRTSVQHGYSCLYVSLYLFNSTLPL